MTDTQMTIEQKIARLKSLIAECERQMAVHAVEFDDRNGAYCSNRRARMCHKWHRGQLIKQVEDLESKKSIIGAQAEIPADAPSPLSVGGDTSGGQASTNMQAPESHPTGTVEAAAAV